MTDVYGRRCAVTGGKDSAYFGCRTHQTIWPGRQHEITNGLLLRTDIHRLFDLGYVTVSNEGRFEVGQRLKEDFENGRHYYALHGRSILMPSHPEQRPKREAT